MRNGRVSKAGLVIALIGVLTIVAKAFTPEYIDESGMLHEWFFLLPVGFGLILVGVVLVIAGKIINRNRRG